jgi:hypothetical protein
MLRICLWRWQQSGYIHQFFDLYWLKNFCSHCRLLHANGSTRRHLPAGNDNCHHGTFHEGGIVAPHRDRCLHTFSQAS